MLKKRVAELEKMKNINKIPLRALEEDFSIRRRSYEKLLGMDLHRAVAFEQILLKLIF